MEFPVDLDQVMSGAVSDRSLRAVIRFGLARQLKTMNGDPEMEMDQRMRFIDRLRQDPIAPLAEVANAQQYELPVEFFRMMLGKRCKYSCAYWTAGVLDLDAAEDAMLDLVCTRAELADGQDVLDLGAGWGALSLYAAERFPNSRILALSGSRTQARHIQSQIAARGLHHVEVECADVASWQPPRRFDRVISVEMFEHLRNYEMLLQRISAWMKPEARLFVHIFCHTRHAYCFEGSFIADHLFTGGMMPSETLLLYFQKDIRVLRQWRVNGTHYQRTCEAWLERLDRCKAEMLSALSSRLNPSEALRWLTRYRLGLLTTAESFGHSGGGEWLVAHYLLGQADACSGLS